MSVSAPALANGSAAFDPFRTFAVAVTMALACLFLATGFLVLKQKAAARGLAIASSVAMILGGGAAIAWDTERAILVAAWVAIVMGAVGIAVFWRRIPLPPAAANAPKYPIAPGSGVHPVLNQLVLFAGAAGGIGGVRVLALWARAHGLPRNYPPFYAVQLLLAILLVLAVHEVGHAVAGMLVRMKLVGLVVGPFYWSYAHGKMRFVFRRAGLVAFGGQTMVAPTTMENFRNRKALQVAGGPIASLLVGAVAVVAILGARGRPWASEWVVLAVFADITTLVGLLNLVPFGNKSMYSDGAKLYQILNGGLWARYHRALGMISSIAVTALRPRDYDIATLEEAAGKIARGRDEAFVRLCAYSFYVDSGRTDEAIAAVAKAEAICREQSIEAPVEWCAAFVLANGLLRHDRAAARMWWDRMEARKGFHFSENLWAARGALAVSEGRFDEAADALAKAETRARALPATGAGDPERGSARLLRLALEEASAKSIA